MDKSPQHGITAVDLTAALIQDAIEHPDPKPSFGNGADSVSSATRNGRHPTSLWPNGYKIILIGLVVAIMVATLVRVYSVYHSASSNIEALDTPLRTSMLPPIQTSHQSISSSTTAPTANIEVDTVNKSLGGIQKENPSNQNGNSTPQSGGTANVESKPGFTVYTYDKIEPDFKTQQVGIEKSGAITAAQPQTNNPIVFNRVERKVVNRVLAITPQTPRMLIKASPEAIAAEQRQNERGLGQRVLQLNTVEVKPIEKNERPEVQPKETISQDTAKVVDEQIKPTPMVNMQVNTQQTARIEAERNTCITVLGKTRAHLAEGQMMIYAGSTIQCVRKDGKLVLETK